MSLLKDSDVGKLAQAHSVENVLVNRHHRQNVGNLVEGRGGLDILIISEISNRLESEHSGNIAAIEDIALHCCEKHVAGRGIHGTGTPSATAKISIAACPLNGSTVIFWTVSMKRLKAASTFCSSPRDFLNKGIATSGFLSFSSSFS